MQHSHLFTHSSGASGPILQNSLIVSVQADFGEPFYPIEYLGAMMQAVVNGGAQGLRLANPPSIQWAKVHFPQLPVIGITKPEPIPADALNQVYITPDWEHWVSVAEAGADVIAVDATQRKRPGGESLETLVHRFRENYPNLKLMADVATLDDGLAAASLGFDYIGTTLSGYTAETQTTAISGEPDYGLLSALVRQTPVPIILEGRTQAPSQITKGFEQGAYAAVVGSAITRPHVITSWFLKACGF